LEVQYQEDCGKVKRIGERRSGEPPLGSDQKNESGSADLTSRNFYTILKAWYFWLHRFYAACME